ncbi:FadR/GntR family transcriptional regulator [Magnetovibrio sp. PR-2]|uniref:FadR/GntR family transcriptional regulator n=1 Tax=Magnetovibrio sp. PR-2 TaxID=3120356 RepID=UPI002FCE00F5
MKQDWKDMKKLAMGQRTYSSRSLHGQVVHELGKRIVTGDIDEGAVLPNETELGASFAVSRTALREGIKVLAAKGLLASRTRTGTRVRPRNEWNMLDPDVMAWQLSSGQPHKFLNDLVEFRRAVEPLAASLAAQRATDADVQVIKQAYDDMELAGSDIGAGVLPDLRFHQGIFHASGNELLAPLGTLTEAALSVSFRVLTSETKQESLRLHKAVLEAIQTRDSAAAQSAMTALLDATQHRVTSLMEETVQ